MPPCCRSITPSASIRPPILNRRPAYNSSLTTVCSPRSQTRWGPMAIHPPTGINVAPTRSYPGFAIYLGAYYRTKIKGDEKRYHFQKWKWWRRDRTQPNVTPNNRKPATSGTLQLHSLVNAPKRTDTQKLCHFCAIRLTRQTSNCKLPTLLYKLRAPQNFQMGSASTVQPFGGLPAQEVSR